MWFASSLYSRVLNYRWEPAAATKGNQPVLDYALTLLLKISSAHGKERWNLLISYRYCEVQQIFCVLYFVICVWYGYGDEVSTAGWWGGGKELILCETDGAGTE